MSEYRPLDVTLGTPAGTVVSGPELAAHMGVEYQPVAARFDQVALAATEMAEIELGYAFRSRSVTFEVEGLRDVGVLLPWGPATNVAVTESSTPPVSVDTFTVARLYPNADFLCVESVMDFTVTYEVGNDADYSDLVKLGVLTLAVGLWDGAGTVPQARTDMIAMLRSYKTRADWY